MTELFLEDKTVNQRQTFDSLNFGSETFGASPHIWTETYSFDVAEEFARLSQLAQPNEMGQIYLEGERSTNASVHGAELLFNLKMSTLVDGTYQFDLRCDMDTSEAPPRGNDRNVWRENKASKAQIFWNALTSSMEGKNGDALYGALVMNYGSVGVNDQSRTNLIPPVILKEMISQTMGGLDSGIFTTEEYMNSTGVSYCHSARVDEALLVHPFQAQMPILRPQ